MLKWINMHFFCVYVLWLCLFDGIYAIGKRDCSSLDVALNITVPMCKGENNGRVELTGSGGTYPYVYEIWSTSTFYQLRHNYFMDFFAGNASVTIIDAAACQKTVNWTFPEATGALYQAEVIQPSCVLGSLTISNISGGTRGSPYEFWFMKRDPVSFQSFDYVYNGTQGVIFSLRDLDPGDYRYGVGEKNWCPPILHDFTLEAPTELSLQCIAQSSHCSSMSGFVSCTSTGGAGGNVFILQDSQGNNSTEPFSQVAPGDYTAFVADRNGCTASSQLLTILPPPPPLNFSLVIDQPVCYGGIGLVTVGTIFGGKEENFPYEIQINGPLTSYLRNINSLTPNFGVPRSVGSYEIYLTDWDGCGSEKLAVVVNPPELVVNCSIVQPKCTGGSGSISCTASGGTGTRFSSLTYENGTVVSDAANVESGSYAFIARDNNGCVKRRDIVIASVAPVNATVITSNRTCTKLGEVHIIPSGGSGSGFTISLNGGPWSNVFTYNLEANTYSYSLRDNNSCPFSSSFTIESNATDCADRCEQGQALNATSGVCAGLCEFPGACQPNSDCSVRFGNVICTCHANLSGPNCTDGTGCSVANGGCDPRVSCIWNAQTELLTCGSCPVGTEGNGVSGCIARCGNGQCEPGILEDCVSCPIDCHETTCNKCGDGFCDIRIGEDCRTCYSDCKSCEPIPCPGGCLHGTCQEGVCICTGNWTGPTCSIAPVPYNTSLNSTSPDIAIDAESARFEIGVRALGELGDASRVISANALNFKLNTTRTGGNVTHNYTASLVNGASMSVLISLKPTAAEVNFGNTTVFTQRTLVVTTQVREWPFASLGNSLFIEMSFLGENSAKIPVSCTNRGDAVKWIMVDSGVATLYGQFDELAELDGRERVIKHIGGANNSISSIIPHFWSSARLQYEINVMVGTEAGLCNNWNATPPTNATSTTQANNNAEKGKSNDRTLVIVLTVISCVLGAIVIIVVIYGAFSWFNKERLGGTNKRKKVNSMPMGDSTRSFSL